MKLSKKQTKNTLPWKWFDIQKQNRIIIRKNNFTGKIFTINFIFTEINRLFSMGNLRLFNVFG